MGYLYLVLLLSLLGCSSQMTSRLTGDSSISPITAIISDNSSDHVNKRRRYEEELPQELWDEIFVRSSVKSLLSVQCVCTRWHALVRNPSFTKRHLQLQKAMSKNKGRFILKHFDSDNRISNYFLFDEESIASSATSSSSSLCSNPLHYLIREWGDCTFMIEGPVNGLYCVYDGYERVVIWNPATSEASFLPLPSDIFPGGYKVGGSLYEHCIYDGVVGFGTDPLNEEDYKVVLILAYSSEEDPDEDGGFCRLLYTTKTNTWIILEGYDMAGAGFPVRYVSNNTYLNGIYYWLVERDDNDMALAFDMGKQKFQWISTPYTNSDFFCSNIELHNDDIYLFVVDQYLDEIDIWVLIVEESSWRTKNYICGIGGVKKSLGFWKKENELLLVIDDSGDGQTILYNTTSEEITKLGPKGLQSLFKALVYYESLVSLGGGMIKFKGNHASLVKFIKEDHGA